MPGKFPDTICVNARLSGLHPANQVAIMMYDHNQMFGSQFYQRAPLLYSPWISEWTSNSSNDNVTSYISCIFKEIADI